MDSQDLGYYTTLLQGNSNFEENLPTQLSLSPIATQPEPERKKSIKRTNFSIDEDNMIVSAWLNISLDPVHGNDQKQITYWHRIHEFFHKYKTFSSDRNENSLMHRWSTINTSTNKFCGCYSQIEGRNQSGKNEQDKIQDTKAMYQTLYGASFQFEHCWNILRHQPKWLQQTEKKKSKFPKKSKEASPGGSSASTPFSIDLDYDYSPNDAFTKSERPIGRDAEKERLSKRKNKSALKNDDDNDDEAFSKMLEKMVKSKEKMHEEKMKHLELEREEIVMDKDLSSMSDLQAEYWRKRQEEIMKKRGWM